MGINKAIIKELNDLIYDTEQSHRYEDTNSVIDVLNADEKRRVEHDDCYKRTLDELKEIKPEIDKIRVFTYSNDTVLKLMLNKDYVKKEGLCNNGIIVCDYNYDGLIPRTNSIYYRYLIDECDELLEKYVSHCVLNGHDKREYVDTVSNEFRISFGNVDPQIFMSSQLMQNMNKHLFISSDYPKRIALLHDIAVGNYIINTNVRGVEKLFQNGEMIDLLTNLEIYNSDLPEYLKEETKTQKVLRKIK